MTKLPWLAHAGLLLCYHIVLFGARFLYVRCLLLSRHVAVPLHNLVSLCTAPSSNGLSPLERCAGRPRTLAVYTTVWPALAWPTEGPCWLGSAESTFASSPLHQDPLGPVPPIFSQKETSRLCLCPSLEPSFRFLQGHSHR